MIRCWTVPAVVIFAYALMYISGSIYVYSFMLSRWFPDYKSYKDLMDRLILFKFWMAYNAVR